MFGVSLFQKIHAHKLADDLSHLMNMSWHKPDSCNSGTKESTKKHDFWNEGTKKHDLEHGFLARGRAPKSTIFGTRDNNKNHEFVHEGDWAKESNARRRAPKSAIFSTNESTKKHDLEHGFFGTRESTKKHDFVHEGAHQKARSRARFFARGKARFCARRKTLKITFTQNIKNSFFWLLQLLGRTLNMCLKLVWTGRSFGLYAVMLVRKWKYVTKKWIAHAKTQAMATTAPLPQSRPQPFWHRRLTAIIISRFGLRALQAISTDCYVMWYVAQFLWECGTAQPPKWDNVGWTCR